MRCAWSRACKKAVMGVMISGVPPPLASLDARSAMIAVKGGWASVSGMRRPASRTETASHRAFWNYLCDVTRRRWAEGLDQSRAPA